MLNRNSVKILEYLKDNDDWYYLPQLEEAIQGFDNRFFADLKNGNYVDRFTDPNEGPTTDDWGGEVYPEQFRISGKGLAYLEGAQYSRLVELRSWLAVAISVLALLVSIWSACKPQPPVNVYLSSTSTSTDTTSENAEIYSGQDG